MRKDGVFQDSNISKQFDEKLIDLSYKKFQYTIFFEVLGIIFYSLILWQQISDKKLFIIWLIAIISINSLLRFFMFCIYYPKQKNISYHTPNFWKKYFFISYLIAGILWGLGGLFFYYVSDFMYRLVIYIFMIGFVSAPATKLMTYFNTYLAYVAPLAVVIFLLAFSFPLNLSILLFLSSLIYLSFMIQSTYYAHQLLSNSLFLSLTNVVLVEDLKQHEHEILFINKMKEMLQISRNSKEAYSIIHTMAEKFFPNFSGGLSIYNEEKRTLETVSQWGHCDNLITYFHIEDCWSLLEEKIYLFDNANTEIICKHFLKPIAHYICLPLIFQNKIIGLLCLISADINEHYRQLAFMFGEEIVLSLTNIQLLEALQDQAIHDTLTGLFNRRYLDLILDRELTRINRYSGMLCVVMIDFDYFKSINDTYGHEAGDEVLRHFGSLLKNRFRGNDIACRFGGEEFILILIDLNIEKTVQRIQKLCDEFKASRLYFQNQLLPQMTISAGIATAPQDGSTVEEIIHAADQALYEAKKSGRDVIKTHLQ